MLMNHAYALGYGVVRRVYAANLPVNQNLALVRSVEAVGDAHGSRFARAVLADDGMNRPFGHLNVDVVVRQHIAKALRYVSQLKHKISLQFSAFSFQLKATVSLLKAEN
jgi:hypothetical protein